MKKKDLLFIVVIFCLVTSCKEVKNYALIPVQDGTGKKAKSLTEVEQQIWHLKDVELDTIPGISLQRAKDSLLTGEKGKEIISSCFGFKNRYES